MRLSSVLRYVATSLNNLVSRYQVKGKYVEAGPLYKRALKIVEKALGPNHPQVAVVCENMAELCRQSAKKMKPKDWKNVREESGPINEGKRSLVCQ